MDIIGTIANAFESMLAHAHFISIGLGILIATLSTQFLKYPLRLWFYWKGEKTTSMLTPELAAGLHRWCARSIALVTGFVVTFFTWPDGASIAMQACWATLAGLMAPGAYTLVTRKFPSLGEAFTADKIIPAGKPADPPHEDLARDHDGLDDVH